MGTRRFESTEVVYSYKGHQRIRVDGRSNVRRTRRNGDGDGDGNSSSRY